MSSLSIGNGVCGCMLVTLKKRKEKKKVKRKLSLVHRKV